MTSEILGRKYGMLTIVEVRVSGRVKVQCDCGVVCEKLRKHVLSGHTKSCGCYKVTHPSRATPDDRVLGKRFHRLLVSERAPSSNSLTQWLCVCDCGSSVTVATKRLLGGHTKSCGCLQREKARANQSRKGVRPSNWKGIGNMSGSHWAQICWAAKNRKLEVSITHQDCVDLFQAQDGKCALTGLPLQFSELGDATRTTTCTASLDRIDSSRGYIPGNVQWVDKRIQRMKWDFTEEEFIRLCHTVSDFQRGIGAKNHIVGV